MIEINRQFYPESFYCYEDALAQSLFARLADVLPIPARIELSTPGILLPNRVISFYPGSKKSLGSLVLGNSNASRDLLVDSDYHFPSRKAQLSLDGYREAGGDQFSRKTLQPLLEACKEAKSTHAKHDVKISRIALMRYGLDQNLAHAIRFDTTNAGYYLLHLAAPLAQ